MARLLTIGFETGDAKEGGHVSGGTAPAVSTVQASFPGGRSVRCDSTAGNTASLWRRAGAGFYVLGRTYVHRFRVFLTGYPGLTMSLADYRLVGGNGVQVRLTAAGTILARRVVGGVGTDGAASAIPLNTWVRVELAQLAEATGLAGSFSFYLDGVLKESLSGLNFGANAQATCDIGWVTPPGASKVLYLDDLAVNDDQGADQTGLPGDGYIRLLKPRRDEARDTNWLNGPGSGQDLWAGLTGTPPIAAPPTAALVKNTAADATGNYDARLEPYSARVPRTAPIRLVQAIFNVGSDSTTATAGAERLLTIGPAETAMNFANTPVAGAWPAGWRWDLLAPVYGEQLSRAVGPVLRIGKRQAVTRAAFVAAMGLLVEHGAPAAATPSSDPIGLGLEAAFDSRPNDLSYAWTSLDDRFRSFTLQMGRNNELGQMEVGSSSIVVRDSDAYMDPDFSGSPFWPNVKLKTPIRVVARNLAGAPIVFSHYIAGVPRIRVGATYDERVIAGHGPFGILNGTRMGGIVFASDQIVDNRIATLLALIGYQHANVGSGAASMKAKTFPAGDTTTALQYLFNLADSESGVVFEQWGQAEGVRFDGYATLLAASNAATPAITLSDTPGAGEYGYHEPAYTYDSTLFANRWTAIRVGGALKQADDTASQLDHGVVEAPLFNSEAANDGVTQAWCDYRLAQYKRPRARFEALTVKPGADTTLWGILLNLKVGSPIDVIEHTGQPKSPTTTRVLLQGMAVESPAGPAKATTFRLNLWPRIL